VVCQFPSNLAVLITDVSCLCCVLSHILCRFHQSLHASGMVCPRILLVYARDNALQPNPDWNANHLGLNLEGVIGRA
jgi:hypothetical protein